MTKLLKSLVQKTLLKMESYKRKIEKPLVVCEILESLTSLKVDVVGNDKLFFDNIYSGNQCDSYTLDWINLLKKSPLEYYTKSVSNVIIVSRQLKHHIEPENRCVLFCDDPRFVFVNIINKFFKTPTIKSTFVHPAATIADEAVIGNSVYVGANTYVGKSVIGDNVVISPNVTIHDNVQIGANCIIGAGSVIGGEGFGYVRETSSGEMIKFPHLGGVIIGDNVEIGSNVCIDRGGLGDTLIHSGVKIDNLVHLAHNVTIGKNTAIIAHSMIAGSVNIGKRNWVAPCSSIIDQVKIGDDVTIGMSSFVRKSIPDGEVWVGSPARKIR